MRGKRRGLTEQYGHHHAHVPVLQYDVHVICNNRSDPVRYISEEPIERRALVECAGGAGSESVGRHVSCRASGCVAASGRQGGEKGA